MRITLYQNEKNEPIELTEADNIVLTIPDSKVKNVLVALGEAVAKRGDLKLHLVQSYYEVTSPVGVLGGIR